MEGEEEEDTGAGRWSDARAKEHERLTTDVQQWFHSPNLDARTQQSNTVDAPANIGVLKEEEEAPKPPQVTGRKVKGPGGGGHGSWVTFGGKGSGLEKEEEEEEEDTGAKSPFYEMRSHALFSFAADRRV